MVLPDGFATCGKGVLPKAFETRTTHCASAVHTSRFLPDYYLDEKRTNGLERAKKLGVAEVRAQKWQAKHQQSCGRRT